MAKAKPTTKNMVRCLELCHGVENVDGSLATLVEIENRTLRYVPMVNLASQMARSDFFQSKLILTSQE